MIIRKAATVSAAALIAFASPLAAKTAHPLSLSNSPAIERASAPLDEESRLFGEGALVTLALAAIAAVVLWQGYELIKGDDDQPLSP